MSTRTTRVATGVLFALTLVLMVRQAWAVFYPLPPSQDDWQMKYEVEVRPVDDRTLDVAFTLADDGRLKPIYSITIVAFSRQTDSQGGRSYDLKAPIKLQLTEDGQRAGQVRIPRGFEDRALIRILTQTVDGQPQTAGARYYDLPLKKFLNAAPKQASRGEK